MKEGMEKAEVQVTKNTGAAHITVSNQMTSQIWFFWIIVQFSFPDPTCTRSRGSPFIYGLPKAPSVSPATRRLKRGSPLGLHSKWLTTSRKAIRAKGYIGNPTPLSSDLCSRSNKTPVLTEIKCNLSKVPFIFAQIFLLTCWIKHNFRFLLKKSYVTWPRRSNNRSDRRDKFWMHMSTPCGACL